MKAEAPPFKLRPAVMEDRALIVDSWLQSYKDSRFAARIPRDVYWSRFGHVGIVESLVGSADVTVACLPDDESYVYAWCARDGALLHYVWTRADFRRFGIASALLEDLKRSWVEVTHLTAMGEQFACTNGMAVDFLNPYKVLM